MRRPNSKTEKIMELWADGKSKAEIGRQVRCTDGNVSNTIKRELNWDGRSISALTERDISFICLEAAKIKVSPATMARAFLIDAIRDAMGE